MCCGLFAHFLAPFACSKHDIQLDAKETYSKFKSDLYHMQKRSTSYVKKNLSYAVDSSPIFFRPLCA